MHGWRVEEHIFSAASADSLTIKYWHGTPCSHPGQVMALTIDDE